MQVLVVSSLVWIPVGLLVAGLVLVACAPALLGWLRRREAQQARQLFPVVRETLEARFFELAAQSGKPRGLRWKHCDWKPQVVFARENGSGLITALAEVEISFEAEAGGEMEGWGAVADIRSATAVFHYRVGRWGTGGRALFNMQPEQALEKLAGQFEPLE